MLAMAIFLFHEPYALPQFIAFAFIWLGILIFVLGNLIDSRKKGSAYNRRSLSFYSVFKQMF